MVWEDLTKDELIKRLHESDQYVKELQERCSQLEKNNEELSKNCTEQQTVLNEIFNAVPVGIMIVDENTLITQVNNVVANMSLRSQKEMIGRRGGEALRCINSSDPKGCGGGAMCKDCPLRNSVEYVLRTGQSIFNLEIKPKLLVGKVVIEPSLRVNVVRVSILGKNHGVLTLEDISEADKIKILEKENAKQDKLIEKIKEYNRLQAEFFSNISHELRTPLNVLLSTIQLFEFKIRTEKDVINFLGTDKYIRMMRQNCYRLLKLIDNLIDVTKIDSGFMKPQLRYLDIVQVVEEICLSVVEHVEYKGRSLIFDTEVEEKYLNCDPNMIERIMLNLLSNALKFTKSGDEIRIEILDKVNVVHIVVRDTGIGIPKDKQKIIFQRFRQADELLNRRHEGSGIGLSLVKSLVDMHNGKISINHKCEKGSEFTIKLPVNEAGFKLENTLSDRYIHKMNIEKLQVDFADIYE